MLFREERSVQKGLETNKSFVFFETTLNDSAVHPSKDRFVDFASAVGALGQWVSKGE